MNLARPPLFSAMRTLASPALVLTAILTLISCSPKESPSPAPKVAEAASNPAPMVASLDVGKLETITVQATGFGKSAPAAVSEAMRQAVLQVNGAAMDMVTVNTAFGVDLAMDQTAVALKGAAFSEAIRQRSGGLIQNFKVLELAEPVAQTKVGELLSTTKTSENYKAVIEASIGKYTASNDLKKIKLVIAPLRFDRASINVGDRTVSAKEVGAQLRQRIQEALLNTGRFAVLDREFNPEVEAELEMIASGESPKAELSKLSQAVSADIVWIGKINNLAYNKYSKQLQTSDRQLVSYSGGWSINQKLVTVATKQVVTSEVLRGTAPATEATTLSRGVNSTKILGGMTDDLVDQVVASIISKTFPISIVSIEGNNVVLSQGGKALSVGGRYAVAALGQEIKDPQTGQSLGRVENLCCEIVIDRVAPNLSYGRFEKTIPGIEKLPAGALLVKNRLADGVTTALATSDKGTDAKPSVKKSGKGGKDEGELDVSQPNARKTDDRW